MEALSVIFSIGPFGITRTVVTTWGILLVLGVGCWLATRRLSIEQPGMIQTALEGVVQAIESAIASVLPERSTLLLPFVGTLWLFVAVANLVGLIPGLHAPTGDLSTTAALAIVVFLSVHWYGIRSAGLRAYLRHYLSPSPVLLPFHILGEFSRTLALAVRLFGNIMSLEMAALLVAARCRAAGAGARPDAARHRGAGAGLYFRHAGADLHRRRHAITSRTSIHP